MSQVPSPERWRQIESIFQDVVDQTESERERRLSELTHGDLTLRREVESLLEHDTENEITPASIASVDLSQAARNAGQLVGGYRLTHPLAVNRASEVWCAEPTDQATQGIPLDPEQEQRVAIKIFCSDEDRRRIDRFRNEVVFLSRFRHPGIAELICAGKDESSPYIVMRFVPGTDIIRFANRHQLSLFERIDLVIQVCEAVTHAHRHQIVHRDLKPSNVLVTKHRLATVLDFGISKYTGDADSEYLAEGLTATRERPMTLAYGSPEQLRGEAVTFATDLYALGLIVYELFTGHHPYSDSASQSTLALGQELPLFDRVCSQLPDRPSEVVCRDSDALDGQATTAFSHEQIAEDRQTTTRHLSRTLRDYFDDLILRCLAKRPDERFGTIADFCDALQLAKLRSLEQRAPKTLLDLVLRYPRSAIATVTLCAAMFGSVTTAVIIHANREAERPIPPPIVIQRVTATTSEPPWTNWLIELFNTQPEEVTLANHRTMLLSLPPETRSALAANAADNRNAALARFLVETFSGETETYPETAERRWELARAAGYVGLPTVAVRALRNELELALAQRDPDWLGVVASTESPMTSAKTLIRLLLELELHAAAFECGDHRDLPEPDDVELLLLAAESRVLIGWREGAEAPLAKLQQVAETLTENQRERMRFWQAMSKPDEQRLQGLDEWIHVADCDDWDQALVQATAFWAAAKSETERDDAAAARDLLVRARALLRRVGGRGTAVASRVERELCQVLLAGDGIDRAKEQLAETWHELDETGELSSSGSVSVALRHADFAQPRDQERVLDRLEPYQLIHQQFPYVYREVLDARAELAIANENWSDAERALTPLVDLEDELWSEDSYSTARARGRLAFVFRVQGKGREESRFTSELRRFARSRIKEFVDVPARGFLLPILEVEPHEGPYPNYLWLEKFEYQHDNSIEVQENMIRFEAEQISEDHPEVAALLRSVIKD